MSSRLIVVIDTSVWISGVYYRGNPFRVLQEWRDAQFELINTQATLEEITRRLRDKAIQFGADPTLAEDWVEYISVFANLVEPTGAGQGVTRDPKDDKFLDAAVSGKAVFLVSSDHDLLSLKEYQGIKIVSPKEFLEILASVSS